MPTRARRAMMLGIPVDKLPDGRGKHNKHFRGERSPLEERFWAKVCKTKTCWLWTASVNQDGYGMIGVAGRKVCGAHRVSYTLHYGEIPEGVCVCHSCDKPSCVRPDHLWLGTHEDNMRDREAKGRGNQIGPVGERAHSAKLNAGQVAEIRILCGGNKITQQECALRFGVHKATINDIVRGKTWRHVEW